MPIPSNATIDAATARLRAVPLRFAEHARALPHHGSNGEPDAEEQQDDADTQRPLRRADMSTGMGGGVIPFSISRNEAEGLVREHLAQLPEKYRLPLVYAAIEGLDYATIGAMLDAPTGTVKTLVFRAKQMLKARIAASLGQAQVGHADRR